MVSNATFIRDTTLWLKTQLVSNITDPITSRPGTSKFIMTSYPKREAVYPIITVRCLGTPITRNLGVGSEVHVIQMQMQVRVWARNEKEKDELTQNVIVFLTGNQFPVSTAGTSGNEELWHYGLTSSTQVDETGIPGIKSQILEFRYDFIIGTS